MESRRFACTAGWSRGDSNPRPHTARFQQGKLIARSRTARRSLRYFAVRSCSACWLLHWLLFSVHISAFPGAVFMWHMSAPAAGGSREWVAHGSPDWRRSVGQTWDLLIEDTAAEVPGLAVGVDQPLGRLVRRDVELAEPAATLSARADGLCLCCRARGDAQRGQNGLVHNCDAMAEMVLH